MAAMKINRMKFTFLVIVLLSCFISTHIIYAQSDKSIDDWLNSAVKYIISNEERRAFNKQASREKKIQYIKFFWARRDPDERTKRNEFIDEFIRRINFVNLNLKTALRPGWETPRGYIYICFGPPAEVYSGVLPDQQEVLDKTYPSQRYITWAYRKTLAKSLPPNYEIMFIDLYGDGDYRVTASKYFKKSRFELQMDELFETPRSTFMPPEIDTAIKEINKKYIVQKKLTPKKEIPNITFGGIPFIFTGDFSSTKGSITNFTCNIGIKYKDLLYNIKKEQRSPDLLIEGVLKDKDNKIIDKFSKTIDFKVSFNEIKRLWEQIFFHQAMLSAPPGEYNIQILLLDKISGRIGHFEQNIYFPFIEEQN
jgi:GWxTD domain-containing protein